MHVFDRAALLTWLSNHNTCPNCNTEITAAQLTFVRRVEGAAREVLDGTARVPISYPADIEMQAGYGAQAPRRRCWSLRRKLLATAVAIGGVAAAIFLAIHFTKRHSKATNAPTPPPATTTPPLPDPGVVCNNVLNGPNSYVNLLIEGLFELFSSTTDSATTLLCPDPIANSTLVVDTAQEIHDLGNYIGQEIASTIAPAGNQSVVQSVYTFVSSCFTSSGTAQDPISSSAWESSVTDLTSLKTGAYACLQGLCRRIGVQANFDPSGTTYKCSNIFSNVQGLISHLGAILTQQGRRAYLWY